MKPRFNNFFLGHCLLIYSEGIIKTSLKNCILFHKSLQATTLEHIHLGCLMNRVERTENVRYKWLCTYNCMKRRANKRQAGFVQILQIHIQTAWSMCYSWRLAAHWRTMQYSCTSKQTNIGRVCQIHGDTTPITQHVDIIQRLFSISKDTLEYLTFDATRTVSSVDVTKYPQA